MKHHPVLIIGLAIGLVTLAPPGYTAPTAQRRPSPLEGVKPLDQPVTYTETKIPLGELVQKVAADTNVKLTAARDVADEPVAVVVKEMPARELLEELAELLDYRWARRGKEGAWRYEIWQDLAGKQREAALREAALADVWKRFQQELRQYVEMAGRSQAQLQEIMDAEQRRWDAAQARSPAEQAAFLNSPEERALRPRARIARALWSPISRSIARMLGQLSPEQWKRFREKGELVVSTDPQSGQLAMPAPVVESFRSARPGDLPPGTRVVFPNPEAEERGRRQEQAARDQWAAATGYQVSIRLEANLLKTWGTLRLSADAKPLRSGAPVSIPSVHPGDELLLNSEAIDPDQAAVGDTPERQQALERDPMFGRKEPFTADPKRRSPRPGRESVIPHFFDYLPEVARAYSINFISDAYWSSPRLSPRDLPEGKQTSLLAVLDRLTERRERWDRTGDLVRLRSRTWFFDRPREIPLRLVRRWEEAADQSGALRLEEYVEAAMSLSEAQLESLPYLIDELGLPQDLREVASARGALRLYASLSPAQQQALWQGEPLPVARMSPHQRQLFLAALAERNRGRGVPPDLSGWASGSFSLTSRRLVRVAERSSESGPFSEPATQERDPGAGAAPPAGSGPAAPPPAWADAPGGRTRQPLLSLSFEFRYGPEAPERMFLIVAPS